MKDVTRMFQERAKEIDSYFFLLEELMIKEAKIAFSNGTIHKIDINLAQILRANGFLLLYNIVESSISQAIEAIHNEILTKEIEYDALNQLVKKEIFNYIKKNTKSDNFITGVQNIVTDILKFHPQSREIFSGNVDAREIKALSEKYGFSCKTNARKTKNGENLLTVKRHRNNLAHGFISFQECGKEYSIQQLIEIKDEVIHYVGNILHNVEDYLDKEMYKR
ncbi:MAE_28990/MAE_18760 family HEPN-like nuclease [Runella aurantiaca]|uniref:MAE-28990/MAE-18760-like HEPN domain-containing protein n=1 Tax=Runella aurantiaca TaxID=2282308 RepID=A0A369IBY2_9BACT|nr:MAE_28990/MAE_18760 family HEPN-like nuclease [Runella aurantiaca]RDB07168.1 hypothetical protein DVG78_03860 [Runella aurantiaca]